MSAGIARRPHDPAELFLGSQQAKDALGPVFSDPLHHDHRLPRA
jgi:hypothetical protein